jgi:hypothetical protein
MLGILNPTIEVEKEHIEYVPRPAQLPGLRIGVLDNTKKNAETVLRNIARRLIETHEMKLGMVMHKFYRSPLTESQIDELKSNSDFVIAGVGDCGACSSGSLLDAVILEKAGVPAIPIITDAFDATAKEMAELWGVPEFRYVMMQHPLASLTEDQMELRASGLIGKVLGLLQEGQPS